MTHSLTHSLTYLLTYLHTHSLTYLLTYSLTHLLTHLLDNPELQKFRESLNSDQLKYFKDKTTDIVADLAQKLRDEFIVTKQAMDSTAVFHPEANAHRAHCLYMMKFYNSVISQNIEDVVLRQMQG